MNSGQWTYSKDYSDEQGVADAHLVKFVLKVLSSEADWQTVRQLPSTYCALVRPCMSCFIRIDVGGGYRRRRRRNRDFHLTLTVGIKLNERDDFNFWMQERDLASIARHCFAALDCTLFDNHKDYPPLPTCLLIKWREFVTQQYQDHIFPYLEHWRKTSSFTLTRINSSFICPDLIPLVVAFLIGDRRLPSDIYWQKPVRDRILEM
jgi:hypothetical protein